jgi:hypothetical protein
VTASRGGKDSGVRSLSEAPYLDLFDPEFIANPQETVAKLRRQPSVFRTPLGASVVDRGKVHELLRDRSLHVPRCRRPSTPRRGYARDAGRPAT